MPNAERYAKMLTKGGFMIKDYSREKLLNAIIFFAADGSCAKTKLFKLLHLLDFKHYRETGRSVTGLSYYAWDNGPVPTALNKEFQPATRSVDFDEACEISVENGTQMERFDLKPKAAFKEDIFTPRELRTMKKVKQEFGRLNAAELIDYCHRPGQPWTRVYKNERPSRPIPYELALDGIADKEFFMEEIKEREAFRTKFGSESGVA